MMVFYLLRTRRPEGTLAEYWNQIAIGVTFKF